MNGPSWCARLLLMGLAWAAGGALALADDQVAIRVGEQGLGSLTYRGVEYCAPAGAGRVGFTGAGLKAAKPAEAARFVAVPTAVTVRDYTVTQTYPWGMLVVAYVAQGADLTITATLSNTAGVGLNGWQANVCQLNDRLIFRGGGGTFDFSSEMQWSYYYVQTAGAKLPFEHYPQQHPHVYWWGDRAAPFEATPVKVMFADLTGSWATGVARVEADGGDRWPVSVVAASWEMALPGQVQTDTRRVAIRFRDNAPDDGAAVVQARRRVQALEQQLTAAQAKLKEVNAEVETELADETALLAPEQAVVSLQTDLAQAQTAAQTAGVGAMPSALAVCADGYEAWGRYNFREMVYTDRRPIGAFFGCPDGQRTTTNPNGWFKDRTVDTTTPGGRAAFAKRLLAHMDITIEVLKRAGAQGLIWWDLEGQGQPHPITYIGDPRVLDPAHPMHRSFAPELDTLVEYQGRQMMLVDACFQKLRDAGLKTGLTIRPQLLTYAAPLPVEQARLRVQTAEQQVAAAQGRLREAQEAPEVLIDDLRGVEAAEKELAVRQADLAKAQAELRQAELGPRPSGQCGAPRRAATRSHARRRHLH